MRVSEPDALEHRCGSVAGKGHQGIRRAVADRMDKTIRMIVDDCGTQPDAIQSRFDYSACFDGEDDRQSCRKDGEPAVVLDRDRGYYYFVMLFPASDSIVAFTSSSNKTII